MALTLLMARHGQTDLNINERWQGRIDAPLNAPGLAQAEQLAHALVARARRTAEPVIHALGLSRGWTPISASATSTLSKVHHRRRGGDMGIGTPQVFVR